MAKREDIYKSQLQELGIYQEAFDPEIKTLAELERELVRAKREWGATVKRPEKPSVGHPLYAVVCALRREILAHREALGLTPKALRRLRGQSGEGGPSTKERMNDLLSQIAERVGSYDDGVPDLDTGGGHE